MAMTCSACRSPRAARLDTRQRPKRLYGLRRGHLRRDQLPDEPYIDLAASAHAEFLVSRDRDLLSLATNRSLVGKEFRQRFPRLRILNPVAFLQTHDLLVS
jgi:predicted nucleic acid-binding protein